MPNPITLDSPLGDDLIFESMTVSAGLSMLGEIQLGLLSSDPALSYDDILGKSVTIRANLDNDETRCFNGYVTRFAIGTHRGGRYGYQATVRPWLWLLTRTSDCRIFQDLSVPDIVKKVFEDHSVASFEFKLFRSYRKWDYCVQYRESDFNFVARLLEHAGIYWYFEHSDGQHKLILVDSQSAHDVVSGHESLPYNEGSSDPTLPHVSSWACSREVKPGKAVITSYDFERPSTTLAVDRDKSRSYDLSEYEVFDYQGDYVQSADGSQLAEDRMDELQTRFQLLRGSSNGQSIETGRLLKLERHPRDDQNAEYLVTSVSIHAHVNPSESGGGAGGYRCDFTAIPSSQQFRPPRSTPKPFVQGPQSAMVVGPSGEEIYTDKYGRVKVQFHWDRYGEKNEKSSCWVRVSHPWAGKNFGAIQTPRIGQEVIVDFFEGDPDQPVITGRVYNAEQMPPWELPANATQSGVLTRSSKGGGYGNANAIRFEDKAGSEQLWIHAEKNQDIEVENDETHWVGHDRMKTIDHDETVHVKHDRSEVVDNNENISIGVNRVEKVGNNEIITIGNDHTETIKGSMMATVNKTKSETVGLNSSETVGIAKELTIGGLYQVTVGAAHNTTVGGAKSVEVGGFSAELVGAAKNLTVAGNHTVTVGGKQSVSVKSDRTVNVDGKSTQTVKAEHVFKAKKIDITAEDELTITVGSAKLVMKKDGSILLDGKDVNTKASGKVNVKASGDVIIKGSAIKEN